MRQINKAFLFLSIALGYGCSASKTTITHPAETSSFRSFHVAPIKLHHTFADTGNFSDQLNSLQSITEGLLTEKGYVTEIPEMADGTVNISVQTDRNDTTRTEDIRFNKGAYGSRFPDQNPRIRKLESDHLEIRITRSQDNRVLYSAKCRLSEAQDPVAGVDGNITFNKIEECLREVVDPLSSKL